MLIYNYTGVADDTYMYVRQDPYKQMLAVHSGAFEFIHSVCCYISSREKYKHHAYRNSADMIIMVS